MSMHKFYIWWEPTPRRLKKYSSMIFLKEYGRMKIKSYANAFFYTSKSQSLKDIKSRHKDGILRELFIYED